MPPPEDATAPPGQTGRAGTTGDQLAGRINTHDTDDQAERAAVGALLVADPGLQAEILALVADSDFTDTRLRFIVGAVREMTAAGWPADQVTLTGYVARNALAGPGAPRMHLATELADLAALAPTPVSGVFYAGLVVEGSARRGIRAAGERVALVAEGGSIAELRQVLTGELLAAMKLLRRAELVTP